MKSPSHRRAGPGCAHNSKPHIIGKSDKGEFKVLQRMPLCIGDPEHCVCCGCNAVAHFFYHPDADEYAAWKNQKP